MEGAVLNGSRLLTDITREGSHFVASGQTQEGLRIGTEEPADGAERAGFPETLFMDGHPLKPVASLGEVTQGTFYFDYAADKIHFADDPTGHTVEAGFAPAAFDSKASNVTISNLVIEKFDAPTQHGAINGGEEWTVTNNEVRLNYGVGITVLDGSKVVGNDVHDNGEMGIGGNGANILVERNEIASNGFWSGVDQFWEGGGTKFAQTTDLVVRNNYSHDNHGFGLWTDIDNKGTVYEGNLLVNNDGGGINHEISYDAKIHDNTFIGNGKLAQGGWLWGSAVQLQNSGNVEVYNNHIDMSGGLNGIGLIQQDRGSGAYGEHTTTGNSIHDNVLVSTGGDGLSGGVADYDEAGLLNGGNVFKNNHYYMDGGNHWRWGDFPSGDDWSAYQKDTNQDEGSTLNQGTPSDLSTWLGGSSAAQPSTLPATPAISSPIAATAPAVTEGINAATLPDVEGGAGNDVLYGRSGSVEVHGFAGNDVVHAGPGNEFLFGEAGSDVFVFKDDGSSDSIEDFSSSGAEHDRISLPTNLFRSFEDVLQAAHDVGSDTVIDFGSSHLTINETSVADLRASDFVF